MDYLDKLRNFLNGAQAPIQRQVQNFGNNLMNNVQQQPVQTALRNFNPIIPQTINRVAQIKSPTRNITLGQAVNSSLKSPSAYLPTAFAKGQNVDGSQYGGFLKPVQRPLGQFLGKGVESATFGLAPKTPQAQGRVENIAAGAGFIGGMVLPVGGISAANMIGRAGSSAVSKLLPSATPKLISKVAPVVGYEAAQAGALAGGFKAKGEDVNPAQLLAMGLGGRAAFGTAGKVLGGGFKAQNLPREDLDAAKSALENLAIKKNDIKYMTTQGIEDAKTVKYLAEKYIGKDFVKKASPEQQAQELLNYVRLQQNQPQISMGIKGKGQAAEAGIDPSEIKRVADNLEKNNPGLGRTNAEAMANDVIRNRPFNKPSVPEAGLYDTGEILYRGSKTKGGTPMIGTDLGDGLYYSNKLETAKQYGDKIEELNTKGLKINKIDHNKYDDLVQEEYMRIRDNHPIWDGTRLSALKIRNEAKNTINQRFAKEGYDGIRTNIAGNDVTLIFKKPQYPKEAVAKPFEKRTDAEIKSMLNYEAQSGRVAQQPLSEAGLQGGRLEAVRAFNKTGKIDDAISAYRSDLDSRGIMYGGDKKSADYVTNLINSLKAQQPKGGANIPNVFKEVAKKSKSLEEFNYRIKDMYQSGNHIDSFAQLDEKNGIKQLNNLFKEIKQKPLKSVRFQPKPQGSVQQVANNASNEANSLISNAQDIAQLPGQSQSKKPLFQRQPNIPAQAQNQANSLDDIIAQGREEISSGKPKIDKRTIKDFAEDVYTSWVDRFYPITKVAGNVEKSLKNQGAALRPEYNPIYTIKKYLGAGGIAENRIENDFKPILKMADDLKMSKDDLDLYLINRRKVGFGEIDREIYGSDPVKAKAIKDALEAKYGKQSEEIASKFYNYRGKLFDELVDGGFVAKDKAPIIKKQNPDYAPFYREMETELDNYLGVPSSKLQQAKNPLNKIEGSTKKILSPVESTIADTIRYRAAIEKNNVAKSIVGLQKAMPELNFEKVSQSTPDTITVWENGQKNYYKVGRDIADTVKGLNEEQMNSILKVLSIPSSVLRQGATGRNPAFMIPNMVRDQLDAAINSKYGYVPFLDYARGLSHLLKKDEVYQRWQKSGSQIALSELSGRKSINAMFDEKQGKKKFFDWVTKGLDVAGKYSEQPTRLGLFSKGLKKTGNDLFANMESREGTLDFARMGSKMKTANSLIPFLNVGVQGFDKMIRTAKANPARFTALMGIYGATPTIATTLWNIQNFPEEYKEVPQWEKNTNFIIVTGRNEKGTVDYISIPKGNVIQYISNPLENFMSYAADTNSQTVQQMATQFISSGLPVVGDGSTIQEVATKTIGQNLPQAIKPATENLLNKSFFKYNTKKDEAREIVPYYLKDKAPGDQSYDYTPGAYKTIGKAINVSPLLVQNFLEGTFAGYVKEPLGIYETFKSIADGEKVDKNKAFILRRFLKETYPTSDTKSSGSLIKREVAQAPESSMVSSADASGFKNPFKKKEQPKDTGKITEISWESESGYKTTVKLNEKPKPKTGIDAFNKENTELDNARKIFNAPSDQVTNQQKEEIYKQLGYTKEQLEYDHKASGTFNTDERIDYILSKSPNHDKLINNLTTGRENSVAGNKFATDTVINKLRDLGEISKEEANKLKAINSGKKAVSAGKKAKKITFAKIKPVKIGSTRKTTKTTFKAPKVAKPKVEKIVFKKKKK